MEWQQLQLGSETVYFGVKRENTGSWRKQKARIKVTGNQTLTATVQCPKRTPNVKAEMLQFNVFGPCIIV